MNQHSNARLTPFSRAQIVKRIIGEHHSIAQVALDFGVSQRTVSKWLKRFREEGSEGLNDRSSRPKCSPRTIHPLRVARVLALRLRKLPDFQIARLTRISKASVSRSLRRYRSRLLAKSPPPAPLNRYEHAAAGDLVHFDIKRLARFEKPGHRVTGDRQNDHVKGGGYEYLHIAIDDHSRIAFAQILPAQDAAAAISFLGNSLAFFSKCGFKTRRIYSDNGSCYRSGDFAKQTAALGLKHRFTRPYTPKTNGKAERFIQTSLREWAYACSYPSSNRRAESLPAFLHNYNFHRPHHSLKLKPPISRLRLNRNNLLSLHI